MASSIQYLPREVVYTIAAGEVIDSIAAGLRELIENAIDADATRIVISLWPDRWSLRVVDNGSGMNLENLKLAAAAHTTSKIHHLTDLSQIKTLGFRGEALYSLAHLAKLDIFSRFAGWGSVAYHLRRARITRRHRTDSDRPRYNC